MKVKKWKEYTIEEKGELLNHWWYYFGKSLISPQDWIEFDKLTKTNADQLFDIALFSYTQGESSQLLLEAMRSRRTAAILKYCSSSDIKRQIGDQEDAFLKILVSTYNSPEPNVTMSEEQLIEGLNDIFGGDFQI